MQINQATAALQALEKMHYESHTAGKLTAKHYNYLNALTGKINQALQEANKIHQAYIDLETKTKAALAISQRIATQREAQSNFNIEYELTASRQKIQALKDILAYMCIHCPNDEYLQPARLKKFYTAYGLKIDPFSYQQHCFEEDLINSFAAKNTPLEQQKQYSDLFQFFQFKKAS